VPAKVGSTSFYFWLYQALAGTSWPYAGAPWIQDVSSERWTNLTDIRIARFAAMPFRQRIRALSDPTVGRFALTRDPLERGMSAYYSKVACGTGDADDHAGAIRQLMKQAPKAVASGLAVDSHLNLSVPCLSAVDWGRMVLEARLADATRWDVNAHFMTQADSCGLHTIGYHMLIPLEDNAYGMAHIAAQLGVEAQAPRLGKRHVVSRADKRELPEAATRLLALVYLQDINLLQFPAVGNWSSSRRNGSVAADVAQRAVHTARLTSRGKGRGKGTGKSKSRGVGKQAVIGRER
jgi:hypothetical protein